MQIRVSNPWVPRMRFESKSRLVARCGVYTAFWYVPILQPFQLMRSLLHRSGNKVELSVADYFHDYGKVW